MWLVAQLPLRRSSRWGARSDDRLPLCARADTSRRPTSRCVFQASTAARDALVRRITSTGIGAVETATAWFGDVTDCSIA
jgi:hypothetical protein